MVSCFPRALLVAAIAAPLGLSQTNTPWSDDFDTGYSVGQDPTQPSVKGWEQWDLMPNPGAAISVDQFKTRPHSLFIGGNTDVVQSFAQGTGRWVLGTSVYVPTTGPHALSRDEYFVLLNTYSAGGPKNWSLQLRFEPLSGRVRFIGGPNNGLNMPFLADQWSDIRVDIDLNADTARVFYGQPGFALPFGPPFTWSQGAGGNGTSDLQAIDLFANDQAQGPNPVGGLYYDDMFVHPRMPAARWNRHAADISFAPGTGPGLVDVTALWTVDIADTNVFSDMGTQVTFFVNGQPTGQPPVNPLVWRETQDCSNKQRPDCDETPCGKVGTFGSYVEGTCDEVTVETQVCSCVGPNFTTIIRSMAISSGDTVEIRLTAVAGSLPETFLSDDSLIEVYPGLCAGVTYCIPKPGLVCGVPAISATGYASATANSGFVVSAGPAVPNKTGILLYSDQGKAQVPFNPGGHVLCMPAMGLRRAGPTTTAVGPPCTGVFSVDMNAFAHGLWSPPGGGPSLNPAPYLLTPGKTINCQYWGRDSMATGSFMSDGLEYLVCP